MVSLESLASTDPKLKLWLKPTPEIVNDLIDEVTVARNGYIAIGSAFAKKFQKNADLLYSDDGVIAIKPVEEKTRNSYTVSHLPGRSSCIINASAMVIELHIKTGRYKAIWADNLKSLIFQAERYSVSSVHAKEA